MVTDVHHPQEFPDLLCFSVPPAGIACKMFYSWLWTHLIDVCLSPSAAIHCLESVAARLAGPDSTAMNPVPQGHTARAASSPAPATTGQIATASQGSVRVHQDIW